MPAIDPAIAQQLSAKQNRTAKSFGGLIKGLTNEKSLFSKPIASLDLSSINLKDMKLGSPQDKNDIFSTTLNQKHHSSSSLGKN